MNMSIDSDDRNAWDQAWASMLHRRLLVSPKTDVGAFGELVDVTISGVPPEHADKVQPATEICPVCGKIADESARVLASLYPRFSNDFSYGIGVWVHKSCFEQCPVIDDPTPIPW